MMGIAELIDRNDSCKIVAAAEQYLGIACERCGVTGYSDYNRHCTFRELTRLRLGSLARRVEYDSIKGFELARHEWTPEQVTPLGLKRL